MLLRNRRVSPEFWSLGPEPPWLYLRNEASLGEPIDLSFSVRARQPETSGQVMKSKKTTRSLNLSHPPADSYSMCLFLASGDSYSRSSGQTMRMPTLAALVVFTLTLAGCRCPCNQTQSASRNSCPGCSARSSQGTNQSPSYTMEASMNGGYHLAAKEESPPAVSPRALPSTLPEETAPNSAAVRFPQGDKGRPACLAGSGRADDLAGSEHASLPTGANQPAGARARRHAAYQATAEAGLDRLALRRNRIRCRSTFPFRTRTSA